MEPVNPEGKALLEAFRAAQALTPRAREHARGEIARRLSSGDVPELDVPPPDLPSSAAASAGKAIALKLLVVGAVAAAAIGVEVLRSGEEPVVPLPAPASARQAPSAVLPRAVQWAELPRMEPAVADVAGNAERASGQTSHAKQASAKAAREAPVADAGTIARRVAEPRVTPSDLSSAPPPPSSGDAQGGEVRLLSDAHRALTAGDSRRALLLLDEHERRFPGSALAASRTVTRAMAWCAAGDARGREAALAFLRANASSPFAARLRAGCRLP
jgi:hypothetical protein